MAEQPHRWTLEEFISEARKTPGVTGVHRLGDIGFEVSGTLPPPPNMQTIGLQERIDYERERAGLRRLPFVWTPEKTTMGSGPTTYVVRPGAKR